MRISAYTKRHLLHRIGWLHAAVPNANRRPATQ